MIKFGAQSCVYDAVGNPTTYRGKSATWVRGRKLASFDGNSFEYNAQGIRTRKNNIEYYYDSQGRLLKQSNGLEFFYDANGLAGLKYNGENYVYRTDIQGNIIAILDSDGDVVVEYKYDAWGNQIVTGSNPTIGNLNPFRYRSYYYDTETGLYYLQTRYYDPETGRFLNIDSLDYADPETINGLNLYAYCGNNPVMQIDPTGQWFFTLLIAGIVGAIVSAASSAVTQLATEGEVDWGEVGISAAFGAVSGIFATTGVGGVVGQFFIQGALSVGETMAASAYNNDLSNLGVDEIMGSFVLSGLFGMSGAKNAAKEFKKVLQIGDSLKHVLTRDFNKKGVSGFLKTWKNKSKKYIEDFIKPTVRGSAYAGLTQTFVNVTTYWFRFATE